MRELGICDNSISEFATKPHFVQLTIFPTLTRCVSEAVSTGSKMSFCLEHLSELCDGMIVRPLYTCRHCMHSLKIPLGQLSINFHRLQIEIDLNIL